MFWCWPTDDVKNPQQCTACSSRTHFLQYKTIIDMVKAKRVKANCKQNNSPIQNKQMNHIISYNWGFAVSNYVVRHVTKKIQYKTTGYSILLKRNIIRVTTYIYHTNILCDFKDWCTILKLHLVVLKAFDLTFED